MILAPAQLARPTVCHRERSAARREVERPPESSSPPPDGTLAAALAKVKTPADDEVAKQQAAFDQMMQLRTEQEREANAIREFGLAQQKKENDFMEEMIRMI